VLLSAGANSWVLPLLQMRDLTVIPAPHVNLPRIQQIAKQYHSDSVYILLLNYRLDTDCNATFDKDFQGVGHIAARMARFAAETPRAKVDHKKRRMLADQERTVA